VKFLSHWGAGRMYCGSCLRDNALATELIARGHDVLLLPVYTPTHTDEPNVSQTKLFSAALVPTSNSTFRFPKHTCVAR